MTSKIQTDQTYQPVRPGSNLLSRLKRRGQRSQDRLGGWWLWIMLCMKLSDLPLLGGLFLRLAGWPLGHFRNRRVLARIKTYLSPRAQIDSQILRVGSKCFVDDYVTISGQDGLVELADRVHVYRGTIIEVGQGGGVSIGEYTQVQPGCNLNGFLKQIKIGRKVMVSAGCALIPYQHKLDDLMIAMADQPLTSKGDIIIEDDVWLGMGVKVMDGVRIGQGSVVGANAVVTKDIPAYSIAVGVPAKVVGNRQPASSN